MKKIILIMALLLLGGSFTTHSTMNASSLAIAGSHENKLIVTDAECIAYLESRGYTGVTVIYVESDGSRLCDTDYDYNTRVIVIGDKIVGSEDVN